MPLESNITALVTGFGNKITESVSNTSFSQTSYITLISDTPFADSIKCIQTTTTGGVFLSSSVINGIGVGDFTIEFFYKNVRAVSGVSDIFTLASSGGFTIRSSSYGEVIRFVNHQLSGLDVVTGNIYSYGKPSGFVHVAIVRQSSVIKIFVNGALAGQSTSGNHDVYSHNTGDQPKIGGGYETARFTHLRVTIGLARYTAAFTPPSSLFDAYRQVNQDSTLSLATSFSTTQYKNKNKNQTGNLTLTVDPTASKNKFNVNGLTDGTGSINGTVTNKGVGVATTVRLYSTQGMGSLLATTTSDASGNFSFSSLVVGTLYFVVATHGTFADKSGKIVQAA